jgi:tetratricopeptide (TPR) repeat protein
MLMEQTDQDQAATLYESGLATLAHFSAADQGTARVRRLDTVIRQRLGTLLVAAGRASEGIKVLSEVQRRFRQAADADPMDARAQFDLAALDASLADGYEHAGQAREALAADSEFLGTMTRLVGQDGKNAMWRLHYAEALVRWGSAEISLGEASRGQRARDEGISTLVKLAHEGDADANVLSLAANAMTDAHREPQVALTFAERAAASAKQGSAAALITLARAQRAAGHAAEASASAQQALKLLEAHPKSIGNGEQTAQARRIT